MTKDEINADLIEQLTLKQTVSIVAGLQGVDQKQLHKAGELLYNAAKNGGTVFVAGNGGSAAISQHWACDHLKGCSDVLFKPEVISLADNLPLITAIGNDIGFEDIYSYQLESLVRSSRDDVLVVVSSSGKSPNIVKALMMAQQYHMKSIALTGFDGGSAKDMATVSLHVPINEYEATEDCHQALMHILAKYIRARHKQEKK